MQLTDDEGQNQADDVKVEETIGYAYSLIDGYLRGRHTLPLSPVPILVKKISIDLSIFHIYSRRYELDMPETMMQRYKNALKLLQAIGTGSIDIAVSRHTRERGLKVISKVL